MTGTRPPGYPLRVISAQASAASGARTGRAGDSGGFRTRWALLISVAGGLALYASFPPADAWPLAVLGPALLVLALTGRSLRGSFGCALAFGLAQFVPLLSWLINLAWYAWAALAGSEAVIFALLAIGQRLLLRLPYWPVAVAGWWVLVEGVRDRWPYAFPWGRLAMSQSVAPDVRWVAFGGAPLLSFLVALAGAMLARAVLAWLAPRVDGRSLVAPTVAHGFRFRPRETDGWVVSFTQGLARALGEQSGAALARFKALASDPVVPLGSGTDTRRLSALCSDLSEEHVLAREGHGLAMRGLLALIAIEVVRLAARRAHSGTPALAPADATVGALRHLIEQHFRREHHVGFYAQRLAMTASRLNDHLKRAAGVTAGHLIRQRLLIEAKHQLVFTNQAIHEIASELAFPDPSHFTRFFRNNTGTTPQEFRAARGG